MSDFNKRHWFHALSGGVVAAIIGIMVSIAFYGYWYRDLHGVNDVHFILVKNGKEIPEIEVEPDDKPPLVVTTIQVSNVMIFGAMVLTAVYTLVMFRKIVPESEVLSNAEKDIYHRKSYGDIFTLVRGNTDELRLKYDKQSSTRKNLSKVEYHFNTILLLIYYTIGARIIFAGIMMIVVGVFSFLFFTLIGSVAKFTLVFPFFVTTGITAVYLGLIGYYVMQWCVNFRTSDLVWLAIFVFVFGLFLSMISANNPSWWKIAISNLGIPVDAQALEEAIEEETSALSARDENIAEQEKEEIKPETRLADGTNLTERADVIFDVTLYASAVMFLAYGLEIGTLAMAVRNNELKDDGQWPVKSPYTIMIGSALMGFCVSLIAIQDRGAIHNFGATGASIIMGVAMLFSVGLPIIVRHWEKSKQSTPIYFRWLLVLIEKIVVGIKSLLASLIKPLAQIQWIQNMTQSVREWYTNQMVIVPNDFDLSFAWISTFLGFGLVGLFVSQTQGWFGLSFTGVEIASFAIFAFWIYFLSIFILGNIAVEEFKQGRTAPDPTQYYLATMQAQNS